LNARDLAWAAGFLEGDGYFGRNTTTQEVAVHQKQLWPLERLKLLFGGSIHPTRRQGILCADYWRWRISGATARGLMMSVYSLLSPEKQEQVLHALAMPIQWRKAQSR